MIGIVSWPVRFIVAPEKLSAYVMDPAHEEGASKGVYLGSYGFSADDPDTLRDALIAHAVIENFHGIKVGNWGLKFLFDGPMPAPNGYDATLMTVWQVDASNTAGTARFVTTRPSSRKRKGR